MCEFAADTAVRCVLRVHIARITAEFKFLARGEDARRSPFLFVCTARLLRKYIYRSIVIVVGFGQICRRFAFPSFGWCRFLVGTLTLAVTLR